MCLEVDYRLNLAVCGDSAGEVFPADTGDTNLNDRLPVHEEESPHHDDDREQNPEPRA
jgi:hypothetical protein